jgi:release factor glutamine methyltransferase
VKISDALLKAKDDLDASGVSNGKLDSLILLSHTIFFSKEQIIFNPNFELNLEQQKSFFDLIARRVKREPTSQIIGKREFFGEEFFISKDVLDPRPDSESLIELVLKNFSDKTQNFRILELGVGSGCLIITLLKAYKEACGVGIDISEMALKICQKNSEIHHVQNRLQLQKSDLFTMINLSEKFDLIISNPPYISSQEIQTLEPEVRIYEPRTALDGGIDGLNFYRKIAAEAKNFLAKNGKMALEIGFGQREAVVEIFTANKFSFLESRQDLSGIERALFFERNANY